MGTRTNAERYARPLAEIIGVAADDTVVRYGVMSLSFLFLLAAAYIFGPTERLGAVATLALAILLILFIIYWWFLEEARKRRVMLSEEQPRENDSSNPDLRDEVAFACVLLFIVTALVLQTLNDSSLHFKVEPDILGLKSIFCGVHPNAFCSANARLFELPAWLFYTLQSFLTTIPMADQVGDYAAKMTGVTPTADTPAFVPTSLRLLFGGLLFTVVIGSFQKVGRQIDAAIEALAHTHTLAAGMGPIVLMRLRTVLQDASQERKWQNALLAVADIAQRYPGARSEIVRLFAEDLSAKFDSIDPATRDAAKIERLKSLAVTFCAMQFSDGLNLIFERIQQGSDREYTKIHLVKVVASNLDREIAQDFFSQLDTTSMKKMLSRAVDTARDELKDEDEEDPAVDLAPPPNRTRKRPPDTNQQDLPLT